MRKYSSRLSDAVKVKNDAFMNKKRELWQPKNLTDIFFTNGEKYKDKNALNYKVDHRYEKLTYGELRDEIVKTVLVLQDLGIKAGDYVLIVSENRPEWVIADVAIMSVGAISVPIHKNLAPSQVKCILDETKPVLAFFSDATALETIKNNTQNTIKHCISFDKVPIADALLFSDMLEKQKLNDTTVERVKFRALSIDAHTIMTVVYTSGTTGKPKGAQMTHDNFLSMILGNPITKMPDEDSKEVCFSILPLSHVYERVAGNFLVFYTGSSICYCLDIGNFINEIKVCRPTIIVAVPRLYEKIYEQIVSKIDKLPLLKKIFDSAVAGEKQNMVAKLVLDKLVLSKLKLGLGGNLRLCVSGGSAIDERIATMFRLADIMFVSGYGLTETSATVSNSDPWSNKQNTSGRVVNGLSVKVVNDEIVVKGPSVMAGYLNKDDMVGAFTEDGYFKTGDLGEIDDDGYIKITGRKKDVQVLTTGEKIIPTIIENAIAVSPYVEQVLLIGDGYKHIAAIIVPNVENISRSLNINVKDVLKNEKSLRLLLDEEIKEAVKDLPEIQRVRKYIIAKTPFSVENDQMTASLKPRRKNIIDAYSSEIKKLYSRR